MVKKLNCNPLPDLIVKHDRIDNPKNHKWNLIPFIYKGGTKVTFYKTDIDLVDKLIDLPFQSYRVLIAEAIKEVAEELLDVGKSQVTVTTFLSCLKLFFSYLDDNDIVIVIDNINKVRHSIYEYSEYQFNRAITGLVIHQTAYSNVARCGLFLNYIYEGLEFDIGKTRLKHTKKLKTAISYESEKMLLTDAKKLANFCFEFIQRFDPNSLRSGKLPIILELNKLVVNLTPARKTKTTTSKNFVNTEAYLAFNFRVTAEVMIFLAMTIQNQAQVYNLKRSVFDYKPLGENYEIREYKARRGGEVLFKIPKVYKANFQKYLAFLDEYALDSEWLFPYLEKYVGFRKRTDSETSKLSRLCSRLGITWIKPSVFRSLGENILMRLSSDEKTASDYANHSLATFRESYELPSLQRTMIEVNRFWNENDPVIIGKPTLSLFNSPCNGIPISTNSDLKVLPQPDCISPTGCISCDHYRDEESFDYVWGLYSFRYLKIIESGSHRTKDQKPSNLAINWASLKINWFKNSKKEEHQEWVEESELRLEEGDYHPSWSHKIQYFAE